MSLADYVKVHKATGGRIDEWHGKVIGEFICDEIIEVSHNGFVNPFAINREVLQKGHLSNSEFLAYTDHYRIMAPMAFMFRFRVARIALCFYT